MCRCHKAWVQYTLWPLWAMMLGWAQVHWSWSLQRLETTQWTLGMPQSARGCLGMVCAWLGHWTQCVCQLLFFLKVWEAQRDSTYTCCIHGIVVLCCAAFFFEMVLTSKSDDQTGDLKQFLDECNVRHSDCFEKKVRRVSGTNEAKWLLSIYHHNLSSVIW